jgi:hypothetical protein
MSAQNLAYHLRPNKAVDRQLFWELLSRIDNFRTIRAATYIGFGGPFLEDFREMHSRFGITHMVSIEMDETVHRRQRFNRPASCVQCRLGSSGDFFSSFARQRATIVWLDYSETKRREQIEEFQALLLKLSAFDVVKVTLNAHPANLAAIGGDVTNRNLHATRLSRLQEAIGDYLPDNIRTEDMNSDGLSRLLVAALIKASQLILRSSDLVFLPLTAFQYADGQNMVTLAGALVSPAEKSRFLRITGLRRWRMRIADDNVPTKIEVPVLSARERLYLDQRLPRQREASLLRTMGFIGGNTRTDSLQLLRSYRDLYRYYPAFSRVVL